MDRCYPHRVEGYNDLAKGQMSATYRSYPEMFFSGALTEQQVDDMYHSGGLFIKGLASLYTRCPHFIADTRVCVIVSPSIRVWWLRA